MIKGIVFDKDGTLLEFNDYWVPVAEGAVRSILEWHGLDSSLAPLLLNSIEAYEGCRGLLCYGTYSGICEKMNIALHTVLPNAKDFTQEEVERSYAENLGCGRLVPTCENIRKVFEKLHSMGLKIGLATSDIEDIAVICLRELGIDGLFDIILADDGVILPKPDPAKMNAFCKEFGFAPSEVIMVGDTLVDMIFAERSGAVGVGVAKNEDDKRLLLGNTEYILHDISLLPEFITKLNNSK